MKKPDRMYILQRIVRLAKLPPGKETLGYFSKEQLTALLLFLENCNERLKAQEEILNAESKERI